MNIEAIDSLFAGEQSGRDFWVRFRDGHIFVLDDVHRGQDQGEAPHAVANVVKVLNGSELFAAGPGGPAIFFYLSEVAEVRDAFTNDVLFVAS